MYLTGLSRPTFKWTMLGATVVLVASLYALRTTSQITEVWAAYCAFTCSLLVWAWQEIGFLLGFVTGTRKTECPKGVKGWQKFGFAAEAVLYHELALVVLGAMVWLVTKDGPNQVGLWTYLVLWAMRQSAKLNIYLGVRNLNIEFLPNHLKYLQTYFRRRPMNPLLPVSILVSTLIVMPVWQSMLKSANDNFDAVAYGLVAMLLSLGILEHLFLVIPLPFEALWKWGLRSRISK